jgi:hypothetical protein
MNREVYLTFGVHPFRTVSRHQWYSRTATMVSVFVGELVCQVGAGAMRSEQGNYMKRVLENVRAVIFMWRKL